jgi:hypothetical protein
LHCLSLQNRNVIMHSPTRANRDILWRPSFVWIIFKYSVPPHREHDKSLQQTQLVMRIIWDIHICCLYIMQSFWCLSSYNWAIKGEHTWTSSRSGQFIGSWRNTVLLPFFLSFPRYHNGASCVNLSWGSMEQYLQHNTTMTHIPTDCAIICMLGHMPWGFLTDWSGEWQTQDSPLSRMSEMEGPNGHTALQQFPGCLAPGVPLCAQWAAVTGPSTSYSHPRTGLSWRGWQTQGSTKTGTFLKA